MQSTSCPKDVKQTTIKTLFLYVSLPVFLRLLSFCFLVNEIRSCLKEFGRTSLHKEFLRESEGGLQSEWSVPKLHCCNISHGEDSEKSHRWLVEMSGTGFGDAGKYSHYIKKIEKHLFSCVCEWCDVSFPCVHVQSVLLPGLHGDGGHVAQL